MLSGLLTSVYSEGMETDFIRVATDRCQLWHVALCNVGELAISDECLYSALGGFSQTTIKVEEKPPESGLQRSVEGSEAIFDASSHASCLLRSSGVCVCIATAFDDRTGFDAVDLIAAIDDFSPEQSSLASK